MLCDRTSTKKMTQRTATHVCAAMGCAQQQLQCCIHDHPTCCRPARRPCCNAQLLSAAPLPSISKPDEESMHERHDCCWLCCNTKHAPHHLAMGAGLRLVPSSTGCGRRADSRSPCQ